MNDLKRIKDIMFLHDFFCLIEVYSFRDVSTSALQLIAEAAQADSINKEHPAVEVINGAGITLLRFLDLEILNAKEAASPMRPVVIKLTLDKLSKRYVHTSPYDEAEYVTAPIFTETTYNEFDGYWVNIRMRWEVWSRLREIVSPFTREDIHTIATLGSISHLCFYLFLRLQPTTFTLSIDEIRNALFNERSYVRPRDFIKRILTPVMEVFNNTPYPFTFEKSTTDKDKYVFTVGTNKQIASSCVKS